MLRWQIAEVRVMLGKGEVMLDEEIRTAVLIDGCF